MKVKSNIYNIIREKGAMMKGNDFFEHLVMRKTGKSLEFWLDHYEKVSSNTTSDLLLNE